jgi:hypothetical protein
MSVPMGDVLIAGRQPSAWDVTPHLPRASLHS